MNELGRTHEENAQLRAMIPQLIADSMHEIKGSLADAIASKTRKTLQNASGYCVATVVATVWLLCGYCVATVWAVLRQGGAPALRPRPWAGQILASVVTSQCTLATPGLSMTRPLISRLMVGLPPVDPTSTLRLHGPPCAYTVHLQANVGGQALFGQISDR